MIWSLFRKWRRARYRRAMWDAINYACENRHPWFVPARVNKVHPVNGLRVIRDFERLNGVTFDPLNRRHREVIDQGWRVLITLRHLRIGLGDAAGLRQRETAGAGK